MAPDAKRQKTGGKEEPEPKLEEALVLDRFHRVPTLGGKSPEYGFRSFDLLKLGSATLVDVVRDCQAAFTARSAKQGEKYSRGETFWVPADATPTSALERLALAVFKLHAPEGSYNPSRSGAEWWTLAIDSADDVGWHWDRDYTLEADEGIRLHPHVSTVTYLSDRGAPTLILELAEDPFGDQAQDASLKAEVVHVSRPVVGKHISFDGRWLHAAPCELAPLMSGKAAAEETAAGAEGRPRVTFMVNVWLNYKPVSADPFPAPLAPSLVCKVGTEGDCWLPSGAEVPTSHGRACCAADAKDLRTFTWALSLDCGGEDEEGEEEEQEEKDQEVEASGTEGQATNKRHRRVCLTLPESAFAAGERDSVTIEVPLGFAKVEAAGSHRAA